MNRLDQILELASSGLTDKEIAKRLEIATATVETHWKRIRAKYAVTSRSAAIAQWMSKRAGNDTDQLQSVIKEMSAYIESLHAESARSASVRKHLRTLEMGWAASRSMVYMYDLHEVSQFIYMSESVRVFGWEPSDWTEGRVDIAKLIHPEDIPTIFAARQESIQKGQRSHGYFFRVNTPTDGYIWLYDRQIFTGKSVVDAGIVIGLSTDMTPFIQSGLIQPKAASWGLDIPDFPYFVVS